MTANKMRREDYFDEINRVRSPRNSGSLRKDDAKAKVHKRPVQALSRICRIGSHGVHQGPFEIQVDIRGKCRADIDNVLKGVLDALNGVAYTDDKQCTRATVQLYPGSSHF